MADEQDMSGWGAPLEAVPEERRQELMRLHDEQVTWASSHVVDYKESPFAVSSTNLTGADIFFLAAYALAGRDGDIEAKASELRIRGPRVTKMGNLTVIGGPRITLETLHLEGARASGAQLQHAQLSDAHLEGATLMQVHLENAMLYGVRLKEAWLYDARLENAHMSGAHLEDAELFQAHLDNAVLNDARLENSTLSDARLERAVLRSAHLEGANLQNAYLAGANLWSAFFSASTTLLNVTISDREYGMAALGHVRWGAANLSDIKWPENPILGDERNAVEVEAGIRQVNGASAPIPRTKLAAGPQETVEGAWRSAAGAYRQVASVMRDQGMNDEADRFAYRAHVVQRKVFLLRHRYGAAVGSWFLDLISGYGYKPIRSALAYLLVILLFMAAYSLFGVVDAGCVIAGVSSNGSPLATCSPAHSLTLQEAFVFSLTSFHGRGFFPGGLGLGSPITLVAALEAVIGLLLEVTFIATFTQRFFAR